MKNKYEVLIKQFFGFAIIGFLNTVLNLLITYAIIFIFKNFTYVNDSLVFKANCVGFFLTTLNSYFLNSRFVFKKDTKKHIWPLVKTFLCYGSTFLLSFFLTKIFTDYLKLNVIMIPLLSLAITVPLNFFINKFWSFS